jgi:hypothetical protein
MPSIGKILSDIHKSFAVYRIHHTGAIIFHHFFFLFAPIWELAPTLEHMADFSVS